MSDPKPDLLTGYLEIAEHLGITERAVEAMAAKDKSFPIFKTGRRVRALRSKVDAWLADRAAQVRVEGRTDD